MPLIKSLAMIVIASATFVVSVHGQVAQPNELERLRRQQVEEDTNELERLRRQQVGEDIRSAISQLEELDELVTHGSNTKHLKCMMAIGSAPFCDCLRQEIPVGANFEDYILATTNSKEDLRYAEQEREVKVLIDNTLAARETCVMSVFRVPAPAGPQIR
jgi:hypothetical protein